MRIRMIKDTLRLNPSPELFLEKSVDDLAFLDSVLETLAGTLVKNDSSQYNRNGEWEYISDTEWQFSQILTEFSLESSPFSMNSFPEAHKRIMVLRSHSNARRKALEENSVVTETTQTEPVVSSAELSGLLGGS
ncbi:MAG: hypothetical protein FWD36_06660 [Treponema sp.]|nr:hypothetical protein [Treponema sp.]